MRYKGLRSDSREVKFRDGIKECYSREVKSEPKPEGH